MRVSLILFLCLTLYNTSASVIHVKPKNGGKPLTDAIKAAVDGDTLLVSFGVYIEGNIIVNKSLTLIGENMPVIDGDRKFEVLSIKADNVTIRGFKIQHSNFASLNDPGGIKVYESKNILIENNYVFDNFFGIYIQECSKAILRNNLIVAHGVQEQEIGNGIHCWKSDSLIISGNRISGNRDGIYFEFVTNSVIWRNVAHDNVRYGLHFMFSHNDSYFSNYFRNNGAGVAVMYTRNVTMANNTFAQNWGDAAYGILMKEISDCEMYANSFITNTTAIFMDGVSRVKISKNVIEQNGWGMRIQANCMENLITLNNFKGNTFDVSTNGTLTLNTFDENYWDKYEGYDMNKDGIGDVPFRPLSLFAYVVEQNPTSMLLFRSFFVNLLDKTERVIPTLTPDNFIDNRPLMRAVKL